MYTRNLVLENYGVLPASTSNTFLVFKPAANGEVYEVNPVRYTCTCPAGRKRRPCCHLAQLSLLIKHETRRMLALADDTPMFGHELQLRSEAESLVSKWKEVRH